MVQVKKITIIFIKILMFAVLIQFIFNLGIFKSKYVLNSKEPGDYLIIIKNKTNSDIKNIEIISNGFKIDEDTLINVELIEAKQEFTLTINTNHFKDRDYTMGIRYYDLSGNKVDNFFSTTAFDAHMRGKMFFEILSLDENGVLEIKAYKD